MENKITFKDIVNYTSNIFNGRFIPFLKSEINDSDIKKLFRKMKEGKVTNNYNDQLYNFLKKYYNYNRDVFLTNSGRDAFRFNFQCCCCCSCCRCCSFLFTFQFSISFPDTLLL